MGCGVSRFHLHDEDDGPLNCKSDELPKTNPRSTHALLKNRDELENKNHAKEEEFNKKLVGEDKEREINYMVNIEEKSRIHNDEEEEEDDDDNDDEEDGRISDVNGWVGSPSFRVYCVDCDTEDGFRSNEDVDERENKIHADDKIKLSNAVHTPEKKRGRRFIKVFSHIPSGRNFLNVSTCYNHNFSSHTDSPAKSPKKIMV